MVAKVDAAEVFAAWRFEALLIVAITLADLQRRRPPRSSCGIAMRGSTTWAMFEAEEQYRRIVDTANEGIWCFDAECRTTFVNRQMVAMLGYSAEEMLGRWMTEFMFEEELPDHQAEMERRKRGMGGNYERRFRRKDGTECWAAVSATSLRDRNGQFAGSFGMFADITVRKTDENKLTALQAQLTHASRLATLGELAAGVAHEINQPLCTIVNFAKACKNVASDETPRLSQIRLWSDAIALAAARSGDIVRRMLGFARRGAASRETIAVEQLLDDAMLFVRHDAQSRKVAMRQEMSDSGLAVCADRVQIQQVLVNLLRNSIEAFGDTRPADRQVAIQARPADGLVQVSVSDNGLGSARGRTAEDLRAFFHHQASRLGPGPADQQNDRRGSWRQDLGRRPAKAADWRSISPCRQERTSRKMFPNRTVFVIDDDANLTSFGVRPGELDGVPRQRLRLGRGVPGKRRRRRSGRRGGRSAHAGHERARASGGTLTAQEPLARHHPDRLCPDSDHRAGDSGRGRDDDRQALPRRRSLGCHPNRTGERGDGLDGRSAASRDP